MTFQDKFLSSSHLLNVERKLVTSFWEVRGYPKRSSQPSTIFHALHVYYKLCLPNLSPVSKRTEVQFCEAKDSQSMVIPMHCGMYVVMHCGILVDDIFSNDSAPPYMFIISEVYLYLHPVVSWWSLFFSVSSVSWSRFKCHFCMFIENLIFMSTEKWYLKNMDLKHVT